MDIPIPNKKYSISDWFIAIKLNHVYMTQNQKVYVNVVTVVENGAYYC